MKKKFFLWLFLFLILEVFLAKFLRLTPLDNFFKGDYNYPLIFVYIILSFAAFKWRLLELEKVKVFVPAILFILTLKFIINGKPAGILVNGNLIWQVFPSFFEEILFRGVMLKNFMFIEKTLWPFKLLNFPFVSIILTAFIFSSLHFNSPNMFRHVFEASIYFSLIYFFTKSYLACGLEHYLGKVYPSLWG